MARYVFSDASIRWLESQRFKDDEIEMLQDVLNHIEMHASKGTKADSRLRLPKDAGPKVSTIATLMDSITDVEGRPICFEASGLIEIPDEARNYFEEDLELDELERTATKLKKVKFAHRYSDPRKRGSLKHGKEALD